MARDHSVPGSPGFVVVHGNRLEDLRELLCEFLAAHPPAVLEPEVILVQSNGMKQWLEQGLATHPSIGVCAATRMELPSAFLWQAYRQVLGPEKVPVRMPFDKTQLIWRLYRLLPQLARSDRTYAALRGYTGEPVDPRKLYQLSVVLADVFDGYQSYRADWLADWERGRDRVQAHPGSSAEDLLKFDDLHRWQAQLWRDLLADAGPGRGSASRAEVHQAFLGALESDGQADRQAVARPWGLSARVIVFGISSLSTQTIEALAALGRYSQVMMFVQNPCRYFWGDVERARTWQQRCRMPPSSVAMAAVPAAGVGAQELLASWGKQGRDYLHLLSDFDQTSVKSHALTRVDAFIDPVIPGVLPSQLAQLQSGLLNLDPADTPARALASDDDSITLVSTFSAQRELEVLHDQLLAWLNADPDLQPRDVMVMVPDMADFVAGIRAVFGRFRPGDPRYIPFTLADPGEPNSPIVLALRQLLGLPGARMSLKEWTTLFEVDAVRKRFGVSPSDVETLSQWLSQAGVRWGLDRGHRVDWGLDAAMPWVDQNTWAFGLRRLLLGYAFGDDTDSAWQGVSPQPGIGGLDAALVGHLLEWLEAVEHSMRVLSVPHSPRRWVGILADLAERFIAPVDAAQERQLQVMLEALEDWEQACADAGLDDGVPLEVVSQHWLTQIEPAALSQAFLGAGVQFATLMPMRAIPFKVVCLLGMTDGAYPRATTARDFDLMALTWRAGDRSRREDDRYLFLEAILSAREKLLISWQGRRPHDNAMQPPSVLVAQLMDFLNQGWTLPRSVVEHPLQPFSSAYFSARRHLQTFDSDWEALHDRSHQGSQSEQPVLATVASPFQAVGLQDLRQLVRQPVEVFFRHRLGVTLDEPETADDEDESFDLQGLARHRAGQSLARASDPERALESLTLSGQMPMAGFGEDAALALRRDHAALSARRNEWQTARMECLGGLPIDLDLEGCRLSGSLDEVWMMTSPEGDAPQWLQLQSELTSLYVDQGVRRRAKVHRLVGLWVQHVALSASGHHVRSVLLGLDGALGFEPLAASDALTILRRWLRAFEEARRRPLPVACMTAWAYLHMSVPKANATGAAAPAALEDAEREAKAHDLARSVFSGAFELAPERKRSPYLARAFADYDDLEHELAHWSELIYGDMHRHLQPLSPPSRHV